MIVTIVAKTRQGGGACVGGISDDGRSLRLVAPDADYNEHANQEYEVGQRWEIDAQPPRQIIPPHVENVVVRRKRLLSPESDLAGFIAGHMVIHEGGPGALYEGLLQATPHGALHISRAGGVPPYSTTFWRPDRPLTLDSGGKRLHYCYPGDDGQRSLTFVGFQEPLAEIPAGTLLRVSLAHWWRPEERPEEELRCFVQLSGWLLPKSDAAAAHPSHHHAAAPPATLDEARATLRRVFGYDTFRPLQEEIIGNVLAGRDSLAIMPTGSGKSLCYQLPALLLPGLTVVVSPLISLMEDQVMQLRELGVAAAYLNSTLTYDAYVAISHRVAAGQVKLLYSAPETLLRPEVLTLLDNSGVACLTIDEAHCISEWGHDFRPEYRQLAEVRRRYADAVCLAVTATATARVRDDIRASLAIPDAAVFVSSFDRANLFLAAEPRVDGLARTLAFLDEHRGQSGIIYCMTRRTVDTLTAQLTARGYEARPYHAGLDNATRLANQRRFIYDETPLMVATVAFGMGIDKSNVRFILHYDLPKDLESYYQQIGRAGRDGLPSDCLLLFSSQDTHTIRRLIEQGDPGQRPGAAARLTAMLTYAEANGCRRRPLLTYFGEAAPAEPCGRCDNCLAGDRETIDLTIPAQKFLSCVVRTREIFGAHYLIDILRGSRRKEIVERGHDRLSTYNIGGEFTKKEWQELARQFVSNGLLAQDMEHGSLKLTPQGRAVLKGQPYSGPPPAAERAVGRAAARDYDVHLFDRLRQVRLELARQADVPAFVIFSDATLREMAIYYPQTPDALAQMQGVGAVKLERYGQALLAAIRDYCAERDIAERPKAGRAAEPRPASAPRGPSRREEVVDLYRQGYALGEIAAMFNVRPQTVAQHLWDALRDGETALPAEPLLAASALPPAERERVLAAFRELGVERLRPVYDALGEGVAYEELHILRLYCVIQANEG